ncbi:hypothetical protein [Arthrobacter sp. MDT1-65]
MSLTIPDTVRPSRLAPEQSLGGFVHGPYQFDNRIWTPEAIDEHEDFVRHMAVA